MQATREWYSPDGGDVRSHLVAARDALIAALSRPYADVPEAAAEARDLIVLAIEQGDAAMVSNEVVIRVSLDDAEEIAEALHSKAVYVSQGFYGPQEEPGADERWVADLNRLEELVREAPVEEGTP